MTVLDSCNIIQKFRKELIVMTPDETEVIDYMCVNNMDTTLENIKDPLQLELAIFYLIHYMNDLHLKKKIFLGDLKPANVFVNINFGKYTMLITVDAGSMIFLEDNKDN
jgi:hypothetical protein